LNPETSARIASTIPDSSEPRIRGKGWSSILPFRHQGNRKVLSLETPNQEARFLQGAGLRLPIRRARRERPCSAWDASRPGPAARL
jgi:hypothetical protein